jgi:hypothetical protein
VGRCRPLDRASCSPQSPPARVLGAPSPHRSGAAAGSRRARDTVRVSIHSQQPTISPKCWRAASDDRWTGSASDDRWTGSASDDRWTGSVEPLVAHACGRCYASHSPRALRSFVHRMIRSCCRDLRVRTASRHRLSVMWLNWRHVPCEISSLETVSACQCKPQHDSLAPWHGHVHRNVPMRLASRGHHCARWSLLGWSWSAQVILICSQRCLGNLQSLPPSHPPCHHAMFRLAPCPFHCMHFPKIRALSQALSKTLVLLAAAQSNATRFLLVSWTM